MAPPRKFGEVATLEVHLRLTPRERAEWQAVARETQTTVSALVREAINRYVADYGEREVFRHRSRSGS
jgi:hypothetical protein